MERIPVSSSNVAEVGYDAETGTLEVAFHNGRIYQYFGVPLQVYEGLLATGSKGTFFHENIRKVGYPYTQVG